MGADGSKEGNNSHPGPDPLQQLTSSKLGLLKKKKEHLSGWPERYFVLDGYTLRYWRDRDDAQPAGELDVRKCKLKKIDRQERGEIQPFTIENASQEEKWTLGSDDSRTVQDWLNAIKEADDLYSQNTGDLLELWKALEAPAGKAPDLQKATGRLQALGADEARQLCLKKNFVMRALAASIKGAAGARKPISEVDGGFWTVLHKMTAGSEAGAKLREILFMSLFMPEVTKHQGYKMIKEILLLLSQCDQAGWCVSQLQELQLHCQQKTNVALCPPECGLRMHPTELGEHEFTRIAFPCSNSATLLAKSCTVMLWLRLDGDLHEQSTRHVFQIGMSDQGNQGLNGATLCIHNGRLRWGTHTTEGAHELESKQQLLTNSWQHVAVTFDASSMQKRIFLDGICVQKGQNRVRKSKNKDVKPTNAPLKLVQEDCAFVLYANGDYSAEDRVVSSDQAPFSKWIVNDVLLSSKAASDSDILAELHNQSSIRADLRIARKSTVANPLMGAATECAEEGGLVYAAPLGSSYTAAPDGPKLKRVLLWWNAVMGNDFDQCSLLHAEPCPESCYWEEVNSKYGDLLQLVGVQLVEAARQFVKMLSNAHQMSAEQTDKAINDYLALISAQRAYPKAYIAVAENSGAHTMSQLHRLDPVYLSVDCKNFLDNSRGPSTLLPAPLIDPTGRAQKHAEELTDLLVKTMKLLGSAADFTGGDLVQRLTDGKADANQLKAEYSKYLSGIDDKAPEDSPELQQCIRRAAQRYVNWLQMLIDHRGDRWLPALDVDLMHLAHMMQAPEYHQFCLEVVGEPSDLRTVQPAGETLEQSIARSAAMFGSLVPGTAECYNKGSTWGFFTSIITSDQAAPLDIPPCRKDGEIFQSMPDQNCTGLSAYQRRRRRQQVQAVWDSLADGQNEVPSDLTLQLGTLPHATRQLWTDAANRDVVAGSGADDCIAADQFVGGYEAGLPEEAAEFDAIVAMLKELAGELAADARERARALEEQEAARRAYAAHRTAELAKVYKQVADDQQPLLMAQLQQASAKFSEYLMLLMDPTADAQPAAWCISKKGMMAVEPLDLGCLTAPLVEQLADIYKPDDATSQQAADSEQQFVQVYDAALPDAQSDFDSLVTIYLIVSDSNTQLTAAEVEQASRIFGLLDADAGGTVTAEELAVLHEEAARKHFVEFVDTDGNNQVSVPEWLEHLTNCKVRLGRTDFQEHLDALEAKLIKLKGDALNAEADAEAERRRLRLQQLEDVWDTLSDQQQEAVDLVDALGSLPHEQREIWPAERNTAALGNCNSVVDPTIATKEKFVVAYEAEVFAEAREDPTEFAHIVSVLKELAALSAAAAAAGRRAEVLEKVYDQILEGGSEMHMACMQHASRKFVAGITCGKDSSKQNEGSCLEQGIGKEAIEQLRGMELQFVEQELLAQLDSLWPVSSGGSPRHSPAPAHAKELTAAEIASLTADARALFQAGDKSGDNELSHSELKKEIQKDKELRSRLQVDKWKDFFKAIDPDGDGRVSLQEFIDYYIATATRTMQEAAPESPRSASGGPSKPEFVLAYTEALPAVQCQFDVLVEVFMLVTDDLNGLSADEEQRAGQIFEMMDEDGSGTVTTEELSVLHEGTDRTKFVEWVDADGDNAVSLPEWIGHLMSCKQSLGKTSFNEHLTKLQELCSYLVFRKLQLHRVFAAFDFTSSGFIERHELLRLGQARHQFVGECLWTDQSNTELVASMDQDGDGKVDGPEFVGFFTEALPMAKPKFVHIIEIFLVIAHLSQIDLDAEQKQICEVLFAGMDEMAAPADSLARDDMVIIQGEDKVTLVVFMGDGQEVMGQSDWMDWMRHNKRVRGNDQFNQWLAALQAAFDAFLDSKPLTDGEQQLADRMFAAMDDGVWCQRSTIQIEWLNTLDSNASWAALLARAKEWFGWAGEPDDLRALSRVDWEGVLKEMHKVEGFRSASSFAELLSMLHQLIDLRASERYNADMQYRSEQLRGVFESFDVDKNATLDMGELMRLSDARPMTAHTEWRADRNQTTFSQMDRDSDGKVDCSEFVDFMTDDLPRFRKHFDELIAEFIRIAAVAAAEAAEAARLAAENQAAINSMTAEQLRRVEALFLGLDRDHSGSLELAEIVIVRTDDRSEMLCYLDRDDDGQISLGEWIEWHNYVFIHLPARYTDYDEFLLLLERLLTEWLLAEEAKAAAAIVSPTRQEWQRSRRQARTPRSPRTPRKTASKSLMNYQGHSDWILAVAVLDIDGREILVTASQDTTARVYDVATGEPLCTCSHHQGSVLAIGWTAADPHHVLTGSLDGSVMKWNVLTGALVTPVEECHKKGVLAVEVAADGQTFFTGSRDNTAVHWDWDGKELQRYVGHSKWIQCVALGASGALLYTGSADETIKEWDIGTGNCLHTLSGHTQEITSMVVSGNHLYTGSREATAKRWDLTTKQEVHQFTGHLSVVRDVAVWKGYLFTGSADGTAKCWDVETGECKFTVTGHEFAVTSISLTDGFIFTGSSDATVRKFAFECPL